MKLLLVLAAAATLSGCRFWYKPVPIPNAIGEEKTLFAGDTVNVHRDQRFEVYGPNPEAVYDGYEQLNRAYRAYERHFGAPAPRFAVVLFRDSTRHLDDATVRSFRDRGFELLPYARSHSVRTRPRYGGLDYGGVLWPIAPTAARAMLLRLAETQPPLDGDRSDTTLLERFPFWYRAAVIHLLGDPASPANDLEYVREKRGQSLALRDLLTLIRPPSADSALDPSRRGDADEASLLYAAQASTLARFLIEREGPAVLGRIGKAYLERRSLTEIIAGFHSAPRTVQELEQRWKVWIETREE